MKNFFALLNPEEKIKDTIENFLLKLTEELGCKATEIFVMIKPIRDEFSDDENDENFKIWVYRKEGTAAPALVRETSLKEILSDDE